MQDDKYKIYKKYFQVQQEDAPLVLRPDEVIIKKSRLEELVMIENRYNNLIKNNGRIRTGTD